VVRGFLFWGFHF
jgi:hypothetical protein